MDSFVNVKVERIVSEDGEEIINLDRPYTLWDEGMQSCNHSLESLKYEIYHDSGTITEAKAILNWKNIGTGTKLLQQKYELSFFSVNQQTSNNQNQGYLFHSPTLAAKVEGETVNVANEGFAIMNAGKCINQNTSKVSDLINIKTYNIKVSCSLTKPCLCFIDCWIRGRYERDMYGRIR